jgi:hypothetical protein
VYLAKKKLEPSSLIGCESGRDMLMEHREEVRELDSEGVALLGEDLEEISRSACIKLGVDCSIRRAFRMIRSDSSRNMTSLRSRYPGHFMSDLLHFKHPGLCWSHWKIELLLG